MIRRIGFVLTVVMAALACGAAAATWNLVDFDVYWEAAERLRAGEDLYPAGAATDSLTYRYSSWFAYAFVPLTFLPKAAVATLWSAVGICALVAITWPYLRAGSLEAASFGLICLTVLVWEVGSGNVGPPLIAVIMYTARGRWGPVAIGVFASLKLFPLLYALAYVSERKWRRAAIAGGTAFVLAVPTVLEDLSGYPFGAGETVSLYGISPVLWGVVLLVAVGLAIRTRRWRWSFAALAVLASWTKMWPAVAYLGGLAIGPYNDGALTRRTGSGPRR